MQVTDLGPSHSVSVQSLWMSMHKAPVAMLSARCSRRQAEGHGRLLCGADGVLTRGGPLQDCQGGKCSFSVFYEDS